MPRPKSDTPAYCHHKRSGKANATIDGKQITFPGPHGSDESRAAYERLLAEWRANHRKLPETITGTGPTVNVIASHFWRHAEAHYTNAGGREAINFRYALRALCRLYGDTPAAEFGPKKLKALRDHVTRDREETNKSGKVVKVAGWSRKSTNRQMSQISFVFKWAASEELIPAAVPVALTTVAELRRGAAGVRETFPFGPVADEVVDATLNHLSPTLKAMVQIQRLTGCRGGELSNFVPVTLT